MGAGSTYHYGTTNTNKGTEIKRCTCSGFNPNIWCFIIPQPERVYCIPLLTYAVLAFTVYSQMGSNGAEKAAS